MCAACYVVASIIGAVLGVLATLLTKSRRVIPALANIAVGSAGAAAMAWFVSPLSSDPASGPAGAARIVGAVFGGLVSLAVWQLIRPHR